jgi:hypothetical protein
MKLTKENLIITLGMLKKIYQYNIKNMQDQSEDDDDELPLACGRLEMLEDIIRILVDGKEFEKLSNALIKMTGYIDTDVVNDNE